MNIGNKNRLQPSHSQDHHHQSTYMLQYKCFNNRRVPHANPINKSMTMKRHNDYMKYTKSIIMGGQIGEAYQIENIWMDDEIIRKREDQKLLQKFRQRVSKLKRNVMNGIKLNRYLNENRNRLQISMNVDRMSRCNEIERNKASLGNNRQQNQGEKEKQLKTKNNNAHQTKNFFNSGTNRDQINVNYNAIEAKDIHLPMTMHVSRSTASKVNSRAYSRAHSQNAQRAALNHSFKNGDLSFFQYKKGRKSHNRILVPINQ